MSYSLTRQLVLFTFPLCLCTLILSSAASAIQPESPMDLYTEVVLELLDDPEIGTVNSTCTVKLGNLCECTGKQCTRAPRKLVCKDSKEVTTCTTANKTCGCATESIEE